MRPCSRTTAALRPLGWFAAVLACLTTAAAPAEPARRAGPPNIVFILIDDLGWTDLGCFGSGYYETPHIDRLAAEGMRLTSHHHCPNCVPTRAALMTGQYGPRTGVYTVGSIERFEWSRRPLRPVDNVENLPLDREIVAAALGRAGYATAIFGKWHLGERGGHHPGRRGFDEAITTMNNHFGFTTKPPVPHAADEYLADFLTDRAVDFITRHAAEPFFLYLAHFGVHEPFEAKPDLKKRFTDKPAVGGHGDPTYAAMIASVDESVGRVVGTLAELGLTDDTLVIVTSDNGGLGGYEREGIVVPERLGRSGGITDNAPLRSGKGSLYEGGIRVPFVAKWPGVTTPGGTTDEPTVHVDLYPTFLEVAGAAKPAHPLDGESLVKLFRDPAARLERDAIFQHFSGYLGARAGTWRTTPVSVVQVGRWKLMEFLEDGRLELYDLESDLGETRNRAADMPDMTRRLHERLVAWRREVGAQMPTLNAASAQPVDP